MLKPHKLCKVCQECQKNPKLLKDIYNSTAFLKTSSLTLLQIHKEYTQVHGNKFAYPALRGHVKKHQFMSEADYTNRHLRQIATNAEKSVLKQKLDSMQVWDKVIDEGMDRLNNGELVMKTSDLLKAAKDKSDYELKTKDQQLAMMEMVMYFASGENNESDKYDRRNVEAKTVQNIHPASEFTEDTGDGADGPSGIYYPPAWDAPA
jgi:hypothetical protein